MSSVKCDVAEVQVEPWRIGIEFDGFLEVIVSGAQSVVAVGPPLNEVPNGPAIVLVSLVRTLPWFVAALRT